MLYVSLVLANGEALFSASSNTSRVQSRYQFQFGDEGLALNQLNDWMEANLIPLEPTDPSGWDLFSQMVYTILFAWVIRGSVNDRLRLNFVA